MANGDKKSWLTDNMKWFITIVVSLLAVIIYSSKQMEAICQTVTYNTIKLAEKADRDVVEQRLTILDTKITANNANITIIRQDIKDTQADIKEILKQVKQ